MKIPEGEQVICPGVSCTMRPGKGLSINVKFKMKWYGFPMLAWKTAREEYEIRLWQYPLLIWLIAMHTVLYWVKGSDLPPG